jgi:hypothetical protein
VIKINFFKLGIINISMIILLSGCIGVTSSNVSLQSKDNLYLSSSNTLAYAYMENGTKLGYIKFKYEKPEDGFEVIKINNNGFYPDYYMDSKIEIGENSPGCLVVMKEEAKNYSFCKSAYTRRTILSTGVSAVWNTAATITTVGLNVAVGAIADPKFFDKDKFLQIVKDNNLLQVKNKIFELYNLQNKHNNELSDLYNLELKKYEGNIKNITFKFIYDDKSDLLYNRKLVHDVTIKSVIPDKNLYSYFKFIENEKFYSLNDLNSFINNLNQKLENNFEKTKITYTNDYLKKNFREYKLSIDNDSYFRLNQKISFNGKLFLPKSVIYEYGKKKIIPINITINNANIEDIAPSNFLLTDKNIDVNFNNQSRKNINAIITNKTNSFLTVKSLTSYFNSDVNTFTNVNKEVAPDSQTLNTNSTFALFSSKMTNNLNLHNVTKKILSNKKTDYGFAIKYHIQDSNIEKTIFKKNNYTLLELYKNYL